jgi:hypothetical protein
MKKLIRLTESDLHRIVKESVQRILAESVNEGQGWNLFKSAVDAANSDDFDYNGYKQQVAKDPKGWKQQQKNYIKYGNFEGPNLQKDAYDKNGDASDTMNSFKSVQGDDALPRINHSLRGKIGRAAGLGAAKAYAHGKGIWDRFTHKGNPNEKLNFGG